jgi:uncharacterized protein (DUF2236 family)
VHRVCRENLTDDGHFAHLRVAASRDVTDAHGGLSLTMCGSPVDDRAVEIVSRAQLESSLAELCTVVSDAREGILGPRSVAWQLGGDLGLFLGGGRAALLQLAHPMVAYAIDQHSRTRTDVVGRFQRTFQHVFAMVFGELEDALIAARRVHAIHSRIEGEVDGVRYHANHVHALRWVHATLVDTTLVVRDRLDARPLPIALKDRYVIEMNRFAALFGIPRALLPESHAAHARYMEAMLASDQLSVTPCAREMAKFLIGRGGPAQPALGRIAEAITASLLPAPLADAFELRRSAVTNLGLRGFGVVHRVLPRTLVAIPAHSDALRRLAGKAPSRVAAWKERQLFDLAHRATGA